MTIEFTQRIGGSTIRLSADFPLQGDPWQEKTWPDYQQMSEFWQRICEYELSLLPEDQQAGASFKKLRKQ